MSNNDTATARTAVVFAGGDGVDPNRFAPLPAGAPLIAADSGLAQALALGVQVDVVLGDMDSVDPADLDAARRAGAEVIRHPRNKDATDLELALSHAVEHGFERVIVIGGVGGRIDHFLGNALLLASEELEGVAVQWLTERALLTVVRQDSRLTLPAEPGQIVSLLPLSGSVPGVRTGGLSWPLDGETLHAASTRGISNAATGTSFTVSVEGGILLVVQELRAES